jgi:N-acetylglutamate synthase/N-acetylornithine aminotransferase
MLLGVKMQVEGGVTAAKGFKATGIYGGLRAKGEKPDLALVACDVDATVAGKECDSWGGIVVLMLHLRMDL